MRRQVMVGSAIGLGAIAAIGLLVLASQQGWFGGKAHYLLAQANRAAQQGSLPAAQAHLEELLATFPDSPWADDALLKLGEVHEAQQQLKEARAMYRMLLDRFPDSPLAARTQAKLGDVNVALMFSPTVTDLDALYEVKPGDTLGKVAKANGTTIEFIKRANGIKSHVIRTGQKLKIPKGHFSIVVDKSQNQLMLTEDNQFIKAYPVATGKDNSTPIGTFKIVNRILNTV